MEGVVLSKHAAHSNPSASTTALLDKMQHIHSSFESLSILLHGGLTLGFAHLTARCPLQNGLRQHVQRRQTC